MVPFYIGSLYDTIVILKNGDVPFYPELWKFYLNNLIRYDKVKTVTVVKCILHGHVFVMRMNFIKQCLQISMRHIKQMKSRLF